MTASGPLPGPGQVPASGAGPAAGPASGAGLAPAAAPDGQRARGGAWSAQALLGLVVAELRKALSTSAWWALLVPAALVSMLVTLVLAEFGGLAFLPSLTQARALGLFGSRFAVVFGLVCLTAEFRHRTIATSFLTAPGRIQLLSAKVLVAAAAGVGYAVVCSVFAVIGMLLGGGGLTGTDLPDILRVSAVSLLVFALWAVLGVGVGALIGNQLAAILGVLIYLLLVEGIVAGLATVSGLGHIDGYLPDGAASGSLTGLAEASPFGGTFNGLALPWWLALLIFAGYAALAVLAGAAATLRRDVT